MDWVELPGRQIEIAVAPVARADCARFAQETGRPIPPKSGSSMSPVTGVCVEEASAFAEWLSQQGGHSYRLPALEEMRALADRAHNGLQASGGPFGLQRYVVTGDVLTLSEWLQCLPEQGDGHNRLPCITFPSWLQPDSGASAQGALSEGRYPFVTFRLVRTNGT